MLDRFKQNIRDAGRRAYPDAANRSGGEMLRHLTSLLDSIATGIISLDRKGRIRVFNAAAEKIFRQPRSRVIGKTFADIGASLNAGCTALWERLCDAIWAAGAALDLEQDLIQKDGSRRVISYSVYPLGRMVWSLEKGVVIILEDVTRKKEMEDQISDARKKLLAIFDGITDGIQVIDNDFRITAVNKSMNMLLAGNITIGSRCYETCMSDSEKCRDCPAEETFRTGLPASATRKLMRKKGQNIEERERFVEISTFPLLDRGNRVVQVVEYIKDVTEKARLAERLEQARRLAELGEMAARVAHEVRNPLNAITGAAHFLSSEYTGDETLQKFTSLIKRQATRVDRVASDLLYACKPMFTQLTSVNLNAVLDQSLDILCGQLRDRRIAVVHDLSSDMPAICADELQLEQAFQNLLRNAVEAMPEGGKLHIKSSRLPDGHVEVRIRDSGQGIPEKDRDRIFQSFFTTKVKGTGLGLTIVQRVVRNHSGDICMEHPEEGGTTIIVRLPVDCRTAEARLENSGSPDPISDFRSSTEPL